MHSLFHNDVPFGWTDDKISRAMKVIFEPLIEKVIHPHSYGWFNSIPERSAHEALREILRMRGISWIIEGSLELENFSSNDYQRLAKFFIKYINPDGKDLCFKFFQAACSVSNTKIHPFKQGLAGAKSLWTWLMCQKLSNSGDTLKLLVPSYSWKIICGWINKSGMVITHKMIENEMGYRGSKSDNISVKEQRVDGSWCIDPVPNKKNQSI